MVSAAVQAGGRSNRMGKDKALIPLGGRPLIEHVLTRLDGLCDEILVTTNRPQDYSFLGLRLAPDSVPDAGALHGLRTALEASQGERVLVIGCDMPFVSRALLEHMLLVDPEADVVVPFANGEYEPLHAVYARSCLAQVDEALLAGNRRMISFFPEVRIATIQEPDLSRLDPDRLSFFNINSPGDLAKAESILTKTQPDI